MNIAHWLARAARLWPDRPAILHGTDAVLDYRGLAGRAARLAGGLAEAGLRPGDRVAVFMGNTPDYLVVLQGIWWAGLVAVPINAKLHPREVAFIVADAQATLLFVTPDLAAGIRGVSGEMAGLKTLVTVGDETHRRLGMAPPAGMAERAPDDLAWLFYTSGTTGRPKGVMLTQRNLASMVAGYFTDVDSVEPDDAMVYAAPLSHGAGLYHFVHLLRGARHVVPASGGFDAAELVALAADIGRLSLFAAPTMVRRLVDHLVARGGGGAGFKTIVYGGGPMYVEDIRRALEVMGARFVQIYGQGESPMTITALSRAQLTERDHPRWLARIASVGVAQSGVEVRIADADDRPLPAGEIGEVQVRGDVVMAGYWCNPEATASTLRGGWLHTGDLGTLDADGFLTLRDRAKDVIITGGANVYPREVEEVLLRHPGVREVSVIGAPDAEWGEQVLAFVVADAGVTAADLDACCLDAIARFKRPKAYRFVEALPKNNYGKVLKTVLRTQV